MTENDIYVELADKLGVPNSERFLSILDAMFTTEEARVCRELFNPATSQELAGRLNISEKEISKILDSLVDRGALTRGPTQYAFHTSVLAFHHESVADTAPHTGPNAIPQKVKELWNDFFRNEWSYTFMEHTEKMIQATGRSLPISPAINDAYYFAYGATFERIRLNQETRGIGTWTLAWEYWNGGGWAGLSGVDDPTSGFRPAAAGVYKISWIVPGDWAAITVSGLGPYYWVRARVTAYTSVTSRPKGTRAWIYQTL